MLIAPHVRGMQPYAPIVPLDVLSRRLGLPPERIVKLDANENPYGTSPRALEALARSRDAASASSARGDVPYGFSFASSLTIRSGGSPSRFDSTSSGTMGT